MWAAGERRGWGDEGWVGVGTRGGEKKEEEENDANTVSNR